MPRKTYDPYALPYGAGHIEQRSHAFLARWREKGELQSEPFPTKDAAHAYLLDRWNRKQAGTYVDPSKLTVRMLVDQWIERGSADLKPSTVYIYTSSAKTRIYPDLGDELVTSLSRYRIQHWVDGLRRRGLAANTIHNTVMVLSSALSSAVDLQVIAENPVKGVRQPSPKQEPPAVWSRHDVQSVLRVVARSPMWHALYRLALTTGMRPGELLALQWRDIADGMVTIRRTLTRDALGHDIVGTSAKTGAVRSIVLPADTIAALDMWRREQRVTELPGWVFTLDHGRPFSRTYWNRQHTRFCKEANVTRISPHKLRHTAATLMLSVGVHPRIVQEILGHKDISVTMGTYSIVSEQMQRQAMNSVDDALKTG
jgi:integrase